VPLTRKICYAAPGILEDSRRKRSCFSQFLSDQVLFEYVSLRIGLFLALKVLFGSLRTADCDSHSIVTGSRHSSFPAMSSACFQNPQALSPRPRDSFQPLSTSYWDDQSNPGSHGMTSANLRLATCSNHIEGRLVAYVRPRAAEPSLTMISSPQAGHHRVDVKRAHSFNPIAALLS
jgi:hypothetical protein